MGSSAPSLLTLREPFGRAARLPWGFAHDFRRSRIGHGSEAFLSARLAFQRWAMFDLGWVRVANLEVPIRSGQIVAVEARTLGLCTLNLSRIREAVDEPGLFGFLYATTEMHVEQGEERFLIELEPRTGQVFYELEAVSRPQNALAWLGFPLTRGFQHRFARDSHRRMAAEVDPQAHIR
jgi:YD repeat-containing protein